MVDASTASDLRLGSVAGSPATTDCSARLLRGVADAAGDVDFVVAGAASGTIGLPGPCEVRIYANGVLFGTIPVAILDLDGNGGLGANDLSLWMGDFGTGEFIGRDDYDFSGTLGANDLSQWLDAFGAGNSSESASLCP